ncbi:MAG: transposase [Armatimonadetes bacterium]|nr:transposase [Armatimonadota bacterium]
MISYDKLSRNPSAFRSLTGLNRLLFDRLYSQVEQSLEALRSPETTQDGKTLRQRKPGAGRKYANDMRSRLVMTLFWLRVYPSYPVLAFFFSVDQSTISRNIREILAVLTTLTEFEFERPAKERKQLHSREAVMDAFPEIALVIDGKEQRIRRPKTKRDKDGNITDTQKPYYSGKKKCHTLKNEIAVSPSGRIVSVSASYPGGANHDITVTRKNGLLDKLDPDEGVMTDSGYDGLAKDYPDHKLVQVQKARRNHPLEPEQKQFNTVIGRSRIIVEHSLAQMNQFQILAQMYRHGRERHGDIVRVVAGIVNLRIKERPLKTYPAQLGLAL